VDEQLAALQVSPAPPSRSSSHTSQTSLFQLLHLDSVCLSVYVSLCLQQLSASPPQDHLYLVAASHVVLIPLHLLLPLNCCQVTADSHQADLNHLTTPVTRCCQVLHILLLETRQQLHLLSSDYAAARRDVHQSITLLGRFPTLLAELRAAVHLQVGARLALGVQPHSAVRWSDPAQTAIKASLIQLIDQHWQCRRRAGN